MRYSDHRQKLPTFKRSVYLESLSCHVCWWESKCSNGVGWMASQSMSKDQPAQVHFKRRPFLKEDCYWWNCKSLPWMLIITTLQQSTLNRTRMGVSRCLTNQSDDKVCAVSWQHNVGSFHEVNGFTSSSSQKNAVHRHPPAIF